MTGRAERAEGCPSRLGISVPGRGGCWMLGGDKVRRGGLGMGDWMVAGVVGVLTKEQERFEGAITQSNGYGMQQGVP